MQHNFKKYFGQNFLKNKKVTERIVKNLSPVENVVEIGPGNGVLTEELINKGFNVTAIEIDSELYEHLEAKFRNNPNFKLVKADVMEFQESEITGSYSVVGNLPYNISKPIIKKFLQAKNKPIEMIFMIQKEVAEDYAAVSPRSTFLSNFARAYGNVEYLFNVKKEEFYPQPKVDGGVLKFSLTKDRKEQLPFIKFLKVGFLSPRKTLLNSLGTVYEKNIILEILKDTGLKPTSRAAELSLENWYSLFEKINAQTK